LVVLVLVAVVMLMRMAVLVVLALVSGWGTLLRPVLALHPVSERRPVSTVTEAGPIPAVTEAGPITTISESRTVTSVAEATAVATTVAIAEAAAEAGPITSIAEATPGPPRSLGGWVVAFEQRAARQVDAPLGVDLLHQVLHPAHALIGQVRDVDQPLFAWQDLDEGAEVHQPLDGASILLADLHVLGDGLDHGQRLVLGRSVGGGDHRPAVVLDVDADAGLVGDLADVLAAGPDERAD